MARTARGVSTYSLVGVAFGRQVLNEGDDPGRARQLIAAVLVLAALVAAGLWLTGVLRGTAAIQDCVAAGRTNCAPVR
jgi:hypothetical protein